MKKFKEENLLLSASLKEKNAQKFQGKRAKINYFWSGEKRHECYKESNALSLNLHLTVSWLRIRNALMNLKANVSEWKENCRLDFAFQL